MTNLHVIDGTLYSGKTSIMDILKKEHYCVEEAARIIIEQQLEMQGDLVPWKHFERFQEANYTLQLHLESQATGNLAWCDRGLVSNLAYYADKKIKPPKMLQKRAQARYKTVHILEPLPEYAPDEVRKETPKQRMNIHNHMISEYTKAGYNPHIVPVLNTPEERANWILEDCNMPYLSKEAFVQNIFESITDGKEIPQEGTYVLQERIFDHHENEQQGFYINRLVATEDFTIAHANLSTFARHPSRTDEEIIVYADPLDEKKAESTEGREYMKQHIRRFVHKNKSQLYLREKGIRDFYKDTTKTIPYTKKGSQEVVQYVQEQVNLIKREHE